MIFIKTIFSKIMLAASFLCFSYGILISVGSPRGYQEEIYGRSGIFWKNENDSGDTASEEVRGQLGIAFETKQTQLDHANRASVFFGISYLMLITLFIFRRNRSNDLN